MAENYAAMMRELWETGRQRPLDVFLRNPRIVSWVERMCVKRLDAIMTVVEESSERVRALGVSPDRLAVVSNTPPRTRVQEVRASIGATEGPVDVVYLGLLELHRGLAEVIEAAAILRDRNHPVRVRIVGGGRDEAILRSMAAARGLTDEHLRFHGRVPHEEALRLIAGADIGLVPHRADESWNTTIPNKLFDYMAGGLAVVASDATPVERVLQETGAGLVYRSGDAVALAGAIEQLLDSERRAECARAGTAAVRAHYNWERDTEVMLRLLDQVVPMPRPSDAVQHRDVASPQQLSVRGSRPGVRRES
jgi:glycosyltransferase involved in cell wall biosynthesis